jgi:hypothetical protein
MRKSRQEAMNNSSRTFRWKAWFVAAGALLGAAYAIALLYEGFLAPAYSSRMTAPLTDLAAAQSAYERLPAGASAPDRALAAARLIRADPANAASWMAVAYADRQTYGRLTSVGLTALDHSYALSMYAYGGAPWRICFALENWDRLTPSMRQDVLTEAQTTLKDRILAPRLRSALTRIANPSGRLAAVLLLAQTRPLS